MDDSDELETLRAAKREQLREQLEREAAGLPAETDEPVAVDSTEHFDRLLERERLVLVDFYADWCGPCQMLAPVLDRIAAETTATVAKVDTDAQQELAARHGVRGLPTMILFVDGDPADRLMGMQDESRIRSLIERYDTNAPT